jgi:hypothetical protein
MARIVPLYQKPPSRSAGNGRGSPPALAKSVRKSE